MSKEGREDSNIEEAVYFVNYLLILQSQKFCFSLAFNKCHTEVYQCIQWADFLSGFATLTAEVSPSPVKSLLIKKKKKEEDTAY